MWRFGEIKGDDRSSLTPISLSPPVSPSPFSYTESVHFGVLRVHHVLRILTCGGGGSASGRLIAARLLLVQRFRHAVSRFGEGLGSAAEARRVFALERPLRLRESLLDLADQGAIELGAVLVQGALRREQDVVELVSHLDLLALLPIGDRKSTH